MKFTLDTRADRMLVRAYGAGELRIGDEIVRAPCIVAPDRLVSRWEAQSAATLTLAQLEPVLALAPEVVILGSNAQPRMPAAEVRAALSGRRVGLEVMDLGAACRTFNILVQEERSVVALLFVGS
ncbi:MAG TPA: MTH938/NDUFAF3 family protein [Steroidobacteraceae bacterium]|nr:MTH938/NDUFAF3 family protein [Steroidobacteraceae bacterium]